MRRMPIIIAIAALVLGLAGWRLAQLAAPPPDPEAARVIAADALAALADAPGAVPVDIEALLPGGGWIELLDPALALPRTHSLPHAELRALADCGQPPVTAPTDPKAARWHAFTCGREPLPDDFFARPPRMHPGGASYAALARAHGIADAPGLHAAELTEPLDPARRVLAALDAPAMQAVHRGRAAALAPGWILLRTPGPGRRYRAWPGDRWQTLAAGLPLVAGRAPAGCLARVGDLCWRPRDPAPARTRWSAVALAAAAALSAALLALAWRSRQARRRERAARRFILRSLTHELRTPVTAMTLALDPLRDGYDALPPPAQDALLALSGGLARVQRTLAASARYLALGGRDPERAQPVVIPSINAFARDLLDGAEVELRPLADDRPLRSDPEWLGLCLRNLVENALRHGRPPVQVELSVDGAHLTIVVRDAGDSRGLDLRDMARAFWRGDPSTGLGLGLSLVHEAARSLGGAIEHRADPTEFRLRLPGVT